MSTTPRTDAARGFHDMDTAVSAEDMARLEIELTEAKASFKEERRFLIAEIKELNAERDRPREENKLLKAAQKISEESDEQLIQEARSLQSLGAILAAYDVAVKTRNRLKTELEAMTARAEKAEADTARMDWLQLQGVAYGAGETQKGTCWKIDGEYLFIRDAIDTAMKESIEVPDSVSIEARNPTGGQ